MTDSVRCTSDSPGTFTCEVLLESELESLSCEAPEPAPPPNAQTLPPPPTAEPAVSALVSSFISRTVVPAPPAPVISLAALASCAPSALSIGLAALAGKGPLVTGLSVLKAVLDARDCLILAHDKAAQRNAEDYCTKQGGVVTSVVGDKTFCEVKPTVPER